MRENRRHKKSESNLDLKFRIVHHCGGPKSVSIVAKPTILRTALTNISEITILFW